ncbi:DNA polymerase III subunit chi [Pseudooceanicola sp. 502str34]|jgi:DNA polymerase-3 subunit chi
MGEAYFYHLTRQPLEEALPRLLTMALSREWRIAVRAQDGRRLDWLDQRLWMGRDEDFLPHGIAGGPHDALQPVLLTTGAPANDPACLMAVDGAEVAAEEVRAMERVCILFDGMDEMAVDHARGQWKALTGAGCGAQYWSEESGKWEQKARKEAAG